ncbi:MAG: ATP-binding protein [Syntrophomonadaceae bacterium]|nr:ATP-binding protein [Syntrophomonadaceae bacterium]
MVNQPTFLGTVQDVRGGTISIILDNNTLSGLVFVEGLGYRIGQVGSFVRIPIGYINLYGIVSQVGAGAVPEKLYDQLPHGNRWMTVQLLGEGQKNCSFSRGISQYPTIGDQVHLLTERDLSKIYGHADAKNYVCVGHLASAESIPALVNIDKLVTRHSAVVGTTGSGKSTTVAGLLSSLSEGSRYPSSRILVFDIHGEYASALKDRANIFKINPNEKGGEKPLYIPYWAMNFDELMSITLGNLDDNSRGQVLEKVISLKKEALGSIEREGVSENNLTVDTPVPFSIHKLWLDLHNMVNATHTVQGTAQSEATVAFLLDTRGEKIEPGNALSVIPPKFKPQNQSANSEKIYLSGSNLNIKRQLDYLASRLRDSRYDFLFRPGPWLPDERGQPQDDLDKLLKNWIGGELPITILDLSGIPVSILTTLIGILLRIIYDALFWSRFISEGGRERPLLTILEEAHTYLGQGDNGQAALAVKRIVKEGRKYGIGAMIVSQRPSEIDSTILSQCGTIFAMRLSNSSDRGHVTGAVSDNLEGLFSMLPVLRTGEAIIVGEAVNMPIRTLIDPPPKNRRPDSYDPVIYSLEEEPGGWNRKRENCDYKEMVLTWRRQDPRSPKVKINWRD